MLRFENLNDDTQDLEFAVKTLHDIAQDVGEVFEEAFYKFSLEEQLEILKQYDDEAYNALEMINNLQEFTAHMSFTEAKQFIDHYFALRRPIRDYLDKILAQARDQGYVTTYFGRQRPTPDVKSSNFIVRSAAERTAMNMPIQGTEYFCNSFF